MLPVKNDELDDDKIIVNNGLRNVGGFEDVCKCIYENFDYFYLPKDGNSFLSSTGSAIIAFLSYIMKGVTYGQIRYFFGRKGMNRSMVGRHLTKMVNNKELFKVNLSFEELGGCKNVYCLSKKGYDKYLSDIPSFLVKNRFVAVSKTEEYSLHSYGEALSLLSLMIAGGRFEFDYEVSSSTKGNKAINSVTSDLALLYDDGKRVFIEQDAGTEKTFILYRKLGKYRKNDRFFPSSDTLIFSSYDRLSSKYKNAFSAKAVERIVKVMEANGYNDGFELYSNGLDKFEKLSDYDCLHDLLLVTGACKDVKGVLKPYHGDTVCLGIDDIKLFLNSLSNHDNPYMIRMMEIAQISSARKKFRNLVKYILDAWSERFEENDAVTYCMQASKCYVIPSMLINTYQNEIFNIEYGSETEKIFRGLLSKIYSSVSGAYFKPFALRGEHIEAYLGFPEIFHRNFYKLKNGKRVCFENISEDVAGFVRARICAARARNSNLNLDLILMYTDREDVSYFLEFFVRNELKNILAYEKDSDSFHIYFLRRRNLSIKSDIETAVLDDNGSLTLKKIK